MKNTIRILMIMTAGLLENALEGIHPAHAQDAPDGREVSSGGVALVCRRGNGRIRTAQMLDTYEASILPPYLQFPNSALPVETQIDLAQLRTAENGPFLELLRQELTRIRANITFLPPDTEIPPTNDAFPDVIRHGCDYENVARYRSDGTVIVDPAIFAQLDLLNQAALYLHEAIYAIARTRVGESSSVRPRRLTAHLLATNFDPAVVTQLMHDLSTRPEPVPSYRSSWNDLRSGWYRPDGDPQDCGLNVAVIDETDAPRIILAPSYIHPDRTSESISRQHCRSRSRSAAEITRALRMEYSGETFGMRLSRCRGANCTTHGRRRGLPLSIEVMNSSSFAFSFDGRVYRRIE